MRRKQIGLNTSGPQNPQVRVLQLCSIPGLGAKAVAQACWGGGLMKRGNGNE